MNMKEKDKWEEVWKKEKNIEELLKTVGKDPLRIKYILKYLPRGKILEAGCGDGKYVFYLERLGYEVYGIDFVDAVIERNKRISEESGVGDPSRFKLMDVCKLDFPDNYFDGYLSMGVIEHFQDPTIPLIEAYRVLKKGGIAFITVPNKLPPWHLTRALSVKLKRGNFPWQKEYTKSELEKFATSVGFKCIKSFNCNVKDSFRRGFRLEFPRVIKFSNPFYYMRNVFYWFGEKFEISFPVIGYPSIFVGEKR